MEIRKYLDLIIASAEERCFKNQIGEYLKLHWKEAVGSDQENKLDSFIKAFEMGKNKIKEYPHCDSLIYSIATVLKCGVNFIRCR